MQTDHVLASGALSAWSDHAPFRTCYDQPAYQILWLYLHQLRRYERWYKMPKMGWFGLGLLRITQSLEIATFS